MKAYIPRDIEKNIRSIVRQFPALVVTGPRQSGKSTLLKQLFSRTHSYISLDDPLARERALKDPRLFISELGDAMIIDEIQNAGHLLSYIKIIIDSERSEKGRFIFTGNQQFPLMKGLGDSLAGRIAVIELLPFCVGEKKRSPGGDKLKTTEACFADACLRGSYPELVTKRGIDARMWYAAYLQTYLERDVRSLYAIGDLVDFQRFLQLLASRCAQQLNLSDYARDLGIAVNTVKRWLSVLTSTRIVYLLQPYHENLGKRVTKNPKVYFMDAGLACHLLGIRDKEALMRGPMAGPLFENFCVQEAIKARFNNAEEPRLYYVRSHNDLEVDILVQKNARLYPIECKLSKTPGFAMGNGIVRFRRLFSKLSIMPGRIISLADDSARLSKDVSVQKLDDFLSWLSA
jgi:predicted AAA+ superfamily ATPase